MNNGFVLISLYNVHNLGVHYLASYLRKQGYDVNVIFLKDMIANNGKKATQKEKDLLISILEKINPKIAGISVSCSALFNISKTITREIHSALGIPVVWGGAHATIAPEECIREADYICRGEGETSLNRLLNSFQNVGQEDFSIPNLWTKQNGTIVSNEIEPVDQPFCTLPFPDYSNENKFFVK